MKYRVGHKSSESVSVFHELSGWNQEWIMFFFMISVRLNGISASLYRNTGLFDTDREFVGERGPIGKVGEEKKALQFQLKCFKIFGDSAGIRTIFIYF